MILRAFKADGARGLILLLILSALVAIQWLAPQATLALRYERVAIGAGEWWRLISAHATHMNRAHLVVNLAGTVLVWGLVAEEYSGWRWLCILLAAIAGIDAGLWWLNPDIEWYLGASGVLHGALTAGFVSGALRRDPVSLIGLPILLLKILYEQFGGTLQFTEGMSVVTAAHLYGALAGGAAGAAFRMRRTRPAPAAAPARTPPGSR